MCAHAPPPHVTDAGQSGTSLLMDDTGTGSQSHALYSVYVNDQSIEEICWLAAVCLEHVLLCL